MKAKITSYEYIPSSGASISTGNKGNSRPKNAFRGGNGTYLVAEPPKVMVYYETEEGDRGSVDMYPTIEYNSTRRVSKEYVDALMTWVANQVVDTQNLEDDILQLMSHYIE